MPLIGTVLKIVVSQSTKYKARTENNPFLGPHWCSRFNFGPSLTSISGEGSLRAVLNHTGRSWPGVVASHLSGIHYPCTELWKTFSLFSNLICHLRF